MNTLTKTSDYMLFFRGPDWDHGLSPDELQRTIDRVTAWMNGLQEQGMVKAGQPLASAGKLVSRKKGQPVTDGPYIESKETVGGYLLIAVESFEAALAVARSCPTLDYNITIEVRPVLDECPIFKRARERMLLETR